MDEEQQQHMAYLTMAAEAAGVPVQRLTAGLAASSRANRSRGGSRRSVRFTEGQEPGATQSLADWEEADAAAVAAAAAAGGHEEAAQQTLLQEVQEEDQLLYATGLHVTGTRTLGHPQHRATHQPGVYTTRRTALRASGPAGLGGAAALPGLNTRMHTGESVQAPTSMGYMRYSPKHDLQMSRQYTSTNMWLRTSPWCLTPALQLQCMASPSLLQYQVLQLL
jgi:hypothetical protein